MSINQGEVWLVEFYPKVGNEIAKIRPAVVINHNSIGKLPLKIIVPITNWQDRYKNYPWMIKIEANSDNNLSKTSAVDCFQVKNFSNERFVKKIGTIDNKTLKDIHEKILKCFNPLYTIL